MSRSVDERIVEMQFDNKQFESGIKTSLKSLDNLKRGLNFDSASKSLNNIEKQLKGFSLSGIEKGVDLISSRFTNLGIVGVTALQNITNAAINAGENLLKSITIDPIMSGFKEYETKINSIMTILTNTSSKGTTLDDVKAALNELNTYADQTIYNFAQMTENIGRFTAAGVDLDTSVSSIKGIANLAAASGSNANQAASAMYQLSQAIASGTIRLQDWISVENAGMGGELFQTELMQVAREHGVAIDDLIDKYGSFRYTLTETGWLTSDILTEALNHFTGDLSKEELMAQGYTEERANEIVELGKKASQAATQVRTVTQLFGTMAEQVGSGWAQSWEYIIGDSEQATETLTNISNAFNSIIQPSTDARNAALQFWNINGGREAVIQGITNVLKTLGDILGPIGDAFQDAFPPITGQTLVDISQKFLKLTENFKIGEQTSENIRKTFKALFDVLAFGAKGVTTLVGAFGKLVGAILPAGDGIFGITGTIGSMVSWVIDAAESMDIFGIAVKAVTTPIEFLASVVGVAGKLVGDFINFLNTKINIPSFDSIKEAAQSISEFQDKADGALKTVRKDALGSFGPAIEMFGKFADAVGAAKDKIVDFAKMIKEALTPLVNQVKSAFKDVSFDDILGVGGLVGIAVLIRKVFKRIDEAASNFDKIIDGVVDVLDTARESLEVWQKSIQAGTLLKIAAAVGILAASLIALTFVDPGKLKDGLIGVTVLLAEVVATMEILSHFPVTGIAGAAGSMVIISFAISVLASSLEKLSQFQNWNETWPGLISVLALMVGLAKTLEYLDTGVDGKELIKTSIGLLVFSEAIKRLSDAIVSFSGLSVDSIIKSLGSLAAILGGIGAFIKFSDLDKLSGVRLTIIEIASSMLIMYGAIKLFSMMDVNELVQGLGTVGALIGALAISLRGIGSIEMKGVASSIIAMSMSLSMLLIPIKVLSGMNTSELIQGLAGTAAALGIMSLALGALGQVKVASGSFAGIGAGLVIMATALNLIIIPIKVLGSMPWQSLALGLGSLIVVLASLGTTAALLAPFGASLLAVAGAFALFGVAALSVGAGMVALSAGLGALAVSGAAGIGVLLSLIAGVLAMIPVFMKELALGIVVFAESLADMAPVLGDALVVIILQALESLKEVVPAISDTVLYLIANLLDDLVEYTPRIGEALVDLLISALDILEKNVPTIVQKVASVIRSIMEAIVSLIGDVSADDIRSLLSAISVLIVCYRLLASSAGMAKNALKGALAMAGVMAILSAMLFVISLLPIDETLEIAVSLSALMISLSAAIAILSFIPIPAAISGVAGLAIFVAGLTAVLAALGGLNQIPGFNWLIGEGATVLGMIGTAIGNFIGGIAGGVLSGVTSSFPQIGQDLSDFMTNASPFFEGLQNVDSSSMQGVQALASAILVLTAADVINGLTSWFTGGASLIDFGKQIAEFAPYFKQYADTMVGIDANVVTASANAAKTLAEFATSLPNSGGVAAFFAGENSLSAFAKELAEFGPSFKQYADSVAGLDANVVTNSANAAKAMSELANGLPNTGGVAGFFAGNNDIDTFGEQLKKFGPAIKAYADSVAGMDGDVVVNSANAAQALATLSESLPNSGGFVSLFTGDNTLEGFGENLKSLGNALSDYYTSISEIDLGTMSTATSQMNSLLLLFDNMSNSDGSSIAGFVEQLSKVPSEMSAAVASINSSLVAMSSSIASFGPTISFAFSNIMTSGVNAILSKGGTLRAAGVTVVTSFITSIRASLAGNGVLLTVTMTTMFNTMIMSVRKILGSSQKTFQNDGRMLIVSFINGMQSQRTQATNAVRSIISSVENAADDSNSSFYYVGRDMIQELINGINSKKSDAINAAAKVASESLQAAKRELDSNSPSKKMIQLGEDSDEGLAIGFLNMINRVSDASEQVVDAALTSVGLVLKNLPAILSDDMELAPRITPVLDLTSVSKEVQSLNAMLTLRPIQAGGMIVDSKDVTLAGQFKSGNYSGTPKDDTAKTAIGTGNTFNQYIYSPKSVSRTDIYRQTKNLFALEKGAIRGQ